MRYYYDFHIHTCLSPCADDDMTPNNIAGMAQLIGLDIIAITDHNATANAAAVEKACKRIGGALVVPGMELETSEGIHVVIFFPSFVAAEQAGQDVQAMLPKNPKGGDRQAIMDEFDNLIKNEDTALSMPTELGLYDVAGWAKKYGGACFPAHIDRANTGVISILGGIDRDMGFNTLEITPYAPDGMAEKFREEGYNIISDSDAHSLHLINEKKNFLELDRLSINAVIESIKDKAIN